EPLGLAYGPVEGERRRQLDGVGGGPGARRGRGGHRAGGDEVLHPADGLVLGDAGEQADVGEGTELLISHGGVSQGGARGVTCPDVEGSMSLCPDLYTDRSIMIKISVMRTDVQASVRIRAAPDGSLRPADQGGDDHHDGEDQ